MATDGGDIFPRQPETLINFDFNDIATATGFILYDFAPMVNDSTTTYHLLPSTLIENFYPSHAIDEANNFGVPDYYLSQTTAALKEIDFDTDVFKIPRTVRGTFFARIPWRFSGGGGSTTTTQVILTLYKWDGTNETQFAQGKSPDLTLSTNREYTFTITGDITETIIKKGDQIRLTLGLNVSAISGSSLVNRVSFHPRDIAHLGFDAGNTRSMILIPFKIET